MSIINQLVYNSKPQPEKLNILSLFYNGVFDISLLDTGHNFYGAIDTSAYPFPAIKQHQAPNLFVLQNINQARNIPLDLILFNSRERHEQFFQLCRSLHVPGLIVDHNHINTNNYFIKKHLEQFRIPCVSTSDSTKQQFGGDNIFYHIEDYCGEFEKDIDILIVGSFPETVYPLLINIKNKFPTLKLVGNNPKLQFSEHVETYNDYRNLFKRSKLFVNLLNLVGQTNIPHELFWALKSKCPIISLETLSYTEILNKDNSIVISDIENLIPSIYTLSSNKKKYGELVNHTTDLNKFNNPNFIEDWDTIFKKYSGVYYDR